MNIEISLDNTVEFYKFAKERSKLFNDYEFVLQIEYFEYLCSENKVTSEDLISILDIADFWELWLNNVSAIKKYSAMAVEVGCYAQLLNKYDATAKIMEVN